MASTDEDDVYSGPLTLSDIKKALKLTDPFKLSNTHAESSNLVPNSSIDTPKINNNTKLDETVKWAGLLNNITTAHNILDQTEPENLNEITLSGSILPEQRPFKKNICDVTIKYKKKWGRSSKPNDCLDNSTNISKIIDETEPEFFLEDTLVAEVSKYSFKRTQPFNKINIHYSEIEKRKIVKESPSKFFSIFATNQQPVTKLSKEPTDAAISEEDTSIDFDNTFEEIKHCLSLDSKTKESKLKKYAPTKDTTKIHQDLKAKTDSASKSVSPTPAIRSAISSSPLSLRRPKKADYYPKCSYKSPIKQSQLNTKCCRPKPPFPTYKIPTKIHSPIIVHNRGNTIELQKKELISAENDKENSSSSINKDDKIKTPIFNNENKINSITIMKLNNKPQSSVECLVPAKKKVAYKSILKKRL